MFFFFFPFLRGPGTMILALSWCMTVNTMWQMIQLHECVPGTRFDRYIDLGRYAFGPKLGPWIVLPQQLIVEVGCDIVYMVTGGKCLKKFMEMACATCTPIRQSYWILIFGGLQFFLSQLPNFNSVAGVSLAAAIMSLRYLFLTYKNWTIVCLCPQSESMTGYLFQYFTIYLRKQEDYKNQIHNIYIYIISLYRFLLRWPFEMQLFNHSLGRLLGTWSD